MKQYVFLYFSSTDFSKYMYVPEYDNDIGEYFH